MFKNRFLPCLFVLIASILVGCSGGGADNKGHDTAPALSLSITVPTEYPEGTATDIPVIVTNTGNQTAKNITYQISGQQPVSNQSTNNSSSVQIDSVMAHKCANIEVGSSCQINVHVPADISADSLVFSASNGSSLNNIKTAIIAITGLPVNNLPGTDGLVFYAPSEIPDNATIAIITMVVASPNVGDFNNIVLLDASGNRLNYQVLTGNNGIGMSNLRQGSVVTIAVQIPNNAKQLVIYPQLLQNNSPLPTPTPGPSPTPINPIVIDVVKTAIINVTPDYIYFNESNTSQTITISNSGESVATGLSIELAGVTPQPFAINQAQSTCGNQLESGNACNYVITFNSNLHTAGTSVITLNYFDGKEQKSNTSTFDYKGQNVVAGLSVDSVNNPNFNFTTTTAHSDVSSVVRLTNTGQTDITIGQVSLPSNFTFSPDSSNGCSVGIVLAQQQFCYGVIRYNNNNVTQLTTGEVAVNYSYLDIDGVTTLSSQSVVGLTWSTVQSQATLAIANNSYNIGSIFNNNTALLTQTINVVNIGEASTVGNITAQLNNNTHNLFQISANNCQNGLLAGESCNIVVAYGPAANSINPGVVEAQLGLTYTPSINTSSSQTTTNLTGNIVGAKSAALSVTSSISASIAGNGSISSSYEIESGTSTSITYTLTNSGERPATNFYIESNAITGWSLQANNCGTSQNKISLDVSQSCQVSYSSPITLGSNNVTPSGFSATWVDEDSPNGETQTVSNSTIYINGYQPAAISANTNGILVDSNSNSTTPLTVSLSGGYNVESQIITISGSGFTVTPSSCALDYNNTTCTFSISTTSVTDGIYNLMLNNSGTIAIPVSQIAVTVISGNSWTWMSGSNSLNQLGVYGIKGIPAANNTPGARTAGASWTDLSNNFWIYSGRSYEIGNLGTSNDLWKYDAANNQWVWVAGESYPNVNVPAVYSKTPNATNTPGSRAYSTSWTDLSGNLWLFGGTGYDSLGNGSNPNDLWKYNPTTNQWVWVTGSSNSNQAGVYGTKGTPSPSNIPGSRSGSNSWTDNNGNLWLFGGNGKDSTSTSGGLNDLWKYNIQTNQWTWVSGSKNTQQLGVYGVKGVANSANVPGSRQYASSWADESGNLWLFGGQVYYNNGTTSGYQIKNDLWKYNIQSNQWTWMSGESSDNIPYGVYGTQGVANNTNILGGRTGSASWIDASGNLWIFGGTGYALSGNTTGLNDLWKYDTQTNQWTWMSGANSNAIQYSSYGTKGVPSSSNQPGYRYMASSFISSNGNLFMFGGQGRAATGSTSYINDLWSYTPPK